MYVGWRTQGDVHVIDSLLIALRIVCVTFEPFIPSTCDFCPYSPPFHQDRDHSYSNGRRNQLLVPTRVTRASTTLSVQLFKQKYTLSDSQLHYCLHPVCLLARLSAVQAFTEAHIQSDELLLHKHAGGPRSSRNLRALHMISHSITYDLLSDRQLPRPSFS